MHRRVCCPRARRPEQRRQGPAPHRVRHAADVVPGRPRVQVVLSATSHLEFGGGTLQSSVFLERRLRVHVVRRDRLVFDTRFAPPARRPSAFAHLFAQLSGTFWPHGAAPLTAPCAFALAETEFDRVVDGAATFRSYGARCTIVEIRVPAADLCRPIGLGHGPIALAPHAWDAYRALAGDPSEPAVHHLLSVLGASG